MIRRIVLVRGCQPRQECSEVLSLAQFHLPACSQTTSASVQVSPIELFAWPKTNLSIGATLNRELSPPEIHDRQRQSTEARIGLVSALIITLFALGVGAYTACAGHEVA